ncbi:MAG: DUF333 domain-containing protein [Acetobacter sp.]
MRHTPARSSIFFITTLILAACSTPHEATRNTLANPASTWYIKRGGSLELRNLETGTQGICHLPDGRIIEEWALFRHDHPQPSE